MQKINSSKLFILRVLFVNCVFGISAIYSTSSIADIQSAPKKMAPVTPLASTSLSLSAAKEPTASLNIVSPIAKAPTIKIPTIKHPPIVKDEYSHPGLNENQIIFKFKNYLPVVESKIFQRTDFNNNIKTKIVGEISVMPSVSINLEFSLQNGRDRQLMSEDGVAQTDTGDQLERVKELLGSDYIHSWGRLFERSSSELREEREKAEKRSSEYLPNLNNFYLVNLKEKQGHWLISELLGLDIIETAYYSPMPEPAEDIAPNTLSFVSRQGYLDPASAGGIDAISAWAFPGGRGLNTRIIDIEGTWELEHEDLRPPFYRSGWIINDGDLAELGPWREMIVDGRNHGTAVIGQLVAENNDYGVTGICSDANYGVVSVFNPVMPQLDPSLFLAYVANAVSIATAQLRAGDVILIEQHAPGPGDYESCSPNCGSRFFVPMEYWQAEFEAIQVASALGIVVVEPAGNGSQNLDNPIYGNRFNPTIRHSGAIMVGAGSSDTHAPLWFTNFGSRVDLQGWGEDVMTLGYGDISANGDDQKQWYTSTFSGTSSAAPIVAGAVAVVQGVLRANGRMPYAHADMRNLLVSTGTPQGSPNTGNIGPLPDLNAAINQCLDITPEIYGECSEFLESSPECGGAACVNKPAGFVEGECFFGLFCEDGYYMMHTDQFVCANSL